MRHETPDKALAYIRRLYAPEDALLARINAKLISISRQIQIGPEEGKLLQLLMTLAGVKRVVEIGTLAGYSTLWMARALPEDGHIFTIESESAHSALAKGFFAESGLEDRITLKEGQAQQVLPQLVAEGPFDMVFIDADKISYLHYLGWADAHVKPNGLIVADNTLLFGAVYEDAPTGGVSREAWEVMREFNQRLADTTRYHSVMMSTKEGLTVAVKR